MGGLRMLDRGAQESDLSATLVRHLEAIRMRDLELYRSTLSADDDICVMLRDGIQLRGQAAIMKALEQEFNDATWSSDTEVIWQVETKATAIVVLRVDVYDRDEGARMRHRQYKEVLVFSNRADGWRLVFDHPVEDRAWVRALP